MGLERGDFKNTLPIEKKKKISQLNEFSRRLEQPGLSLSRKAKTSIGNICKAGQPEAQPNSTVWGREGWRLILKQVGKKKTQRWERGGGSYSLRLADRVLSPRSKIELET